MGSGTCVLVSMRSSLWLRYFSLLLITWLGVGERVGVDRGRGRARGRGRGRALTLALTLTLTPNP